MGFLGFVYVHGQGRGGTDGRVDPPVLLRAYMLAHKDRFDDKMMREMSETNGGLPAGSDSAKVRAGSSGSHKAELPPALSECMDAIWAKRIAPVLGFADFAKLDAAL